jgi:hypothetical protein
MSSTTARIPAPLRSILPSLYAFALLTTAAAGYVEITTESEHDVAMAKVAMTLRSCPDIADAANSIAEKRSPTEADAARIVAMGRRASGRVQGCHGIPREAPPPGSLIEEGYWLADRTMQIADACPAVMPSANRAASDGKVDLKEAGNIAVAARRACPSIRLETM